MVYVDVLYLQNLDGRDMLQSKNPFCDSWTKSDEVFAEMQTI